MHFLGQHTRWICEASPLPGGISLAKAARGEPPGPDLQRELDAVFASIYLIEVCSTFKRRMVPNDLTKLRAVLHVFDGGVVTDLELELVRKDGRPVLVDRVLRLEGVARWVKRVKKSSGSAPYTNIEQAV
jgi:hypothetical protein